MAVLQGKGCQDTSLVCRRRERWINRESSRVGYGSGYSKLADILYTGGLADRWKRSQDTLREARDHPSVVDEPCRTCVKSWFDIQVTSPVGWANEGISGMLLCCSPKADEQARETARSFYGTGGVRDMSPRKMGAGYQSWQTDSVGVDPGEMVETVC